LLKKNNSTDRAAGRLSQAEARRWQTVAEVGQELHCPGTSGQMKCESQSLTGE